MSDTAWIDVVGIGEDGLDGLAPSARRLIESAEVLVGGARHHEKIPEFGGERLTWENGFGPALDEIEKRRGKRITVLASGDPMHFGVGTTLGRRFGASALAVFPVPGAFSLAAARMGWSIPDCQLLTIHGRPLENLGLHLSPGARLLVLSKDGGSPAAAAALLTAKGYGNSSITVLEHMGGAQEKRIDGIAANWPQGRAADLNTIAIDCICTDDTVTLSRVPGLPDDAFEHDGQLTKREVRAATLAALQPLPGQVLWDIGAGSGAVAIEWLRLGDERRAVAFESDSARVARIARNAASLGTPALKIVEGHFPDAVAAGALTPDAIFVGGGVSEDGLLNAAWDALGKGGRLVANAVTLEAEQALLTFYQDHGGELVRLNIERAAPIGGKTAFRPMMQITQYSGRKT